MSLQTALSGLTAAQTGLDTISNNLANVNTTAYKSQTALFEDDYPSNATNKPGMGANLEGMDTNETQGNLTSTGNNLDAAIQGDGYFVVNGGSGETQYTRDGAFQLSTTGVLETLNGASVQGYQKQSNGSLSNSLSSITVNTGAMAANPTSKVGLTLDLNSGDSAIPAGTTFDPTNSSTYSESTSVVSYDSLGNANRVNLYFVKNPVATGSSNTTYSVYEEPEDSSGTSVASAALLTTLTFDGSGNLVSGSPASLTTNWQNGSNAQTMSIDFAGSTNQAQTFAVAGDPNDGYAPGTYESTAIDSSGNIVSTYSNGEKQTNGTLAIANFINPEGLEANSGNLFSSTNTSGQAVLDTPGTGQAGTISDGNLEASNSSTSELLVNLIQYQQSYEGDTQVLQTEQADLTKLMQA